MEPTNLQRFLDAADRIAQGAGLSTLRVGVVWTEVDDRPADNPDRPCLVVLALRASLIPGRPPPGEDFVHTDRIHATLLYYDRADLSSLVQELAARRAPRR